jgi:predicted aminopeptidase
LRHGTVFRASSCLQATIDRAIVHALQHATPSPPISRQGPSLKQQRIYLLLIALALVGGCASLGFYGQAARGQAEILLGRRDLAAVIADPKTSPELRRKLALAREARAFAARELGLPDNKSYLRYTDLGRPFVVWNVFAAPALSLKPVETCFPVVGCLSYRGYFREARARLHGAELAAAGNDVYVGGVAAYSTLGWFADPLLNTMVGWDDQRLVKTIFHELAHQRFYVPDDTTFNESFAMAVADLGYARWRAAQGATAEEDVDEARDAALIGLLIEHRGMLKKLYARQDLGDAEKLDLKHTQFAALAADFAQLRASWGNDTRYDRWMNEDMNNAKLSSVATYHEFVPAFKALFAATDEDFTAFYREVEALGQKAAPARKAELQTVGGRTAARL